MSRSETGYAFDALSPVRHVAEKLEQALGNVYNTVAELLG